MNLSACLAGIALATSAVAQPVVINEFQYDDSSTDNLEFVELYNASGAPINVSNWTLYCGDAPFAIPNTDNNADFPLDPGLTGTVVIPAGGYFVLGSSALVPAADLVIGGTNLFENDEEWIVLYDDFNGRIVDIVRYETNKQEFTDATTLQGDGIWGNQGTEGDASSGSAKTISLSRCRDGVDTDDNGFDFFNRPSTPGSSNDIAADYYYDGFDGAARVLTLSADWAGSFWDPQIFDPTAAPVGTPLNPAEATNPTSPATIPASPQGGNAIAFWDPTGGGNTSFLSRDCCVDQVLEAYVWMEIDATRFDAGNTTTEYEVWSIGFGTTGKFFNSPDPQADGVGTGSAFTQNGNTGISLTYEQREGNGTTPAGAFLHLIDHNNGGWGAGATTGATILATATLTAANSGWQRVRLSVLGTSVEARLGGTWGSALDGDIILTGTRGWSNPTPVYVGYRESISTPANERGLVLDHVIRICCDEPGAIAVRPICAPGYHSRGGPVLTVSGMPVLGGPITASISNINTFGTALFFGFEYNPFVPFPLDPMFGSQVCLNPVLVESGLGYMGTTFNIALNPSVCGSLIDMQAFDLDLSSPNPLPYGSSELWRVIVGG